MRSPLLRALRVKIDFFLTSTFHGKNTLFENAYKKVYSTKPKFAPVKNAMKYSFNNWSTNFNFGQQLVNNCSTKSTLGQHLGNVKSENGSFLPRVKSWKWNLEAGVLKFEIQICEYALKQSKHLVDSSTHPKFPVSHFIYSYINPISRFLVSFSKKHFEFGAYFKIHPLCCASLKAIVDKNRYATRGIFFFMPYFEVSKIGFSMIIYCTVGKRIGR